MGVITCTAPMNPTGDVTYTHKKFKRAASEAYDGADQQKEEQQQPKQKQQKDNGKRDKEAAQVVEATARPTTITVSGQPPVNGHLPAQLTYQLTTNVAAHLPSSEGDEVKKKSNGSSGGKYKCDYCGVGCAKPSVLGKHIRTHTNERPYSCDQCRIAFKTKSNFLKHTKSRAHALRCDGVVQDGGDGLVESSECIDADRGESLRCPSWEAGGAGVPQMQHQPADLSVARPSRDPLRDSFVASMAPKLHLDELTKDRGKSLYKPKFRAQYSLQEDGIPKGHHTPPPLLRQQPTPPHDASQLDCNAINPVTYQPHAASNANSHTSPNQQHTVIPTQQHIVSSSQQHTVSLSQQHTVSSSQQHTVSPAQLTKQCLPPLDIRAASANKKEDSALPGQRSSGITPQNANSIWKGKSPSPELLGQHITKLIVENQAIVETHNPLWSRRYRRQSSLGSSSSESDGSGSGKSRRCSLVDVSNKNSKLASAGPPVSYSSVQSHPRERSLSLTGEALMIEPRSSYSPSLPPNSHLPPLAQPPVTLMSASKPSISSHGPTTTSYSQSDPAFATSHMGMHHDLDLLEGPRKRSISESPGVVRDSSKSRLHPKNPEGSVIKNLLLTARSGITGTIDQNLERLEHGRLPSQNAVLAQNLERLEQGRISNQNAVLAEVGPYMCTWCRIRCHSPESLEFHLRHYCGHRQGGSGSERGTPDSIKSGDGGRWPGEQDVALDLQKKDRLDQYDHERSSSRGSSTSIGEATQRRGSDEDVKYRLDLSPRVYGNECPSGVASPPTKKRKMSEVDSVNHDKNMFLSPIFSPKSHLATKGDSVMKIADEMSKHKPSSRHFFGGEVQICDGKNLKTMRIDTVQQPSPSLDICIPPQQLGGSISRSEVSVPTSVVVTFAKSGLNSGGTMVQVESQVSTSSTKTAPTIVNSLLPPEQPPGNHVYPQNKAKPPSVHPSNMYQTNATHFSFSPSSFLQYAPLLQIPNLTIPGIPTPDLGDLPYPMNPPNITSQPYHHGQAPHAQKPNSLHSPVVHSKVVPLPMPQATAGGPLSGSAGPFAGLPGGVSVRSSPVGVALGGLSAVLMRDKEKEHHRMAAGKSQSSSYPALIPIGNEKVPYVPGIPGPYSQAGSVGHSPSPNVQKSPLAVFAPPVPAPSLNPVTSKSHTPVPSPVPLLMSEVKEKVLSVPRCKEPSREPQRIQIKELSPFPGSPKLSPPKMVSHVPPQKDMHVMLDRPKLSISQVKASEYKSVNPEIKIHPVMSSPLPVVTSSPLPPVRLSPIPVMSSSIPVMSSPLTVMSSSLPVMSSPLPIMSSPLTVMSSSLPIMSSPLPIMSSPLPVMSSPLPIMSSPLPIMSSPIPHLSLPIPHLEKKDLEKNQIPIETQNFENCMKDGANDSNNDFLPPRKRPNSLALKPQPFLPKSVSLIGTTLVSPDTPRPKKSCVQMLLNGSAYTYLGHKVSTKSYFCCIYRQQPMYVPQSTDPKLSMYSNWQVKPAESDPFELTPYQSLGLYQSRKYNHDYTIAKEKELNLIQTHSSYWTFKEEKEKKKEKEKEEAKLNVDEKDVKGETSAIKVSEPGTAETSGTSIKREPDDQSDDSSYKTDEADGYEGSAKRIKIFEGGFKSSEDYTYVRGRGRGRYVCGACGIRCKKPSMLKKHIRTHTDLRPYACGHCSFSFKTKGNLTKHLRSKAHYKRCVEMGVDPVPTVVDDSHVNEEALALQGKMEQERIEDEDEDDDDDEDDDEEEGDEDDEDDEAMDEDQFEDADDMPDQEETRSDKDRESRPMDEAKDGRDIIVPAAPVSRAGVLVMVPSVSNASGSISSVVAYGSSEGKGSKTVCNVESNSQYSPMDLSVKKIATSNNPLPAHDKGNPATKKHAVPMRPNFLPLMSKSSATDNKSPIGNLLSPGTPSTPIREHPSEILSPVTESSTLLKSIYETTLRISRVSSGETQNIVPDPTKENGCNASMLQAYLKERAVLDTTFKRQQYKSSSSDTSPDSPRSNSLQVMSDTVMTSLDSDMTEVPHKSESDSNDNTKVRVDEIKKDKQGDVANQGSSVEQNRSTPSPMCTSAVITSTIAQVITSRMPTPPANLTVMNSGGIDTKTAFLVPSGVVPSSLNRLGNDDGKCKCSICHKEFNKQSQLSIHMNIHYMERPFRCDSCAVSFRTNGHLQKHKRSLSHYNKVNMNMTFGTPSTDNPRPFKCHDCKIAFRIHGHLAKHLRSKMHIMKLECLGKLPFGTYAEIERSGANLNEIDTTDCDNSLESLQSMASRLYEKEPSKLAAWQNQQERLHHRVRTVSNSSANSDDYPLQDEQDDPLTGCGNDEDTEGDDDEDLAVPPEIGSRISIPGTPLGPSSTDLQNPQPNALQTIEVGSQQLTQSVVQPYTCGLCEAKFSSHRELLTHSQHHCSSGIVGLKSS